jgi:hypothetical protein
MEKLYKRIVFFVGLIAMNITVHAQLDRYSPYFFASSNASAKIALVNPLLVSLYTTKEVTDFTNYPNPAITQTTIAYTLSARANVNLRVIDLAGKQLTVLVKQEQAAGKQEYYWEFSKNKITSGMYILILQVGNKVFSRKMIVQ